MRVDLEMVDSQIFTLLSEYVIEHYEDITLEDDNFSTVKENPTNAELPFIYLKQLPSVETATDLENDEFRGGLFTFEIRVTSNVSQEQASDIMNVVTRAFKKMGFSGSTLPVFADADNLHIKVARWQRELDDGDEI